MFDFVKSGTLNPNELEAFEPTETKKYIYKFATEISAEIAEKQEKLILTTIQQIDGGEFIHITIDKDKVIEALTDYVNKQNGIPNIEVRHAYFENIMDFGNGNCFAYCSECHTEHKANNPTALKFGHRFCRWCGAKMDGGSNEKDF